MNNEKIFLVQTTTPKLKQIEELERRYFELQMCDHWDSSDYRYAEELRNKIKKLKELKEEN